MNSQNHALVIIFGFPSINKHKIASNYFKRAFYLYLKNMIIQYKVLSVATHPNQKMTLKILPTFNQQPIKDLLFRKTGALIVKVTSANSETKYIQRSILLPQSPANLDKSSPVHLELFILSITRHSWCWASNTAQMYLYPTHLMPSCFPFAGKRWL